MNDSKKPRLENWEVGDDFWTGSPDKIVLRGNVYNHPNPRNYDGKRVATSWVIAISYKNKTARTENTEYELGEPHPDFVKWLKDNGHDIAKYEFPGGTDEKNTPD